MRQPKKWATYYAQEKLAHQLAAYLKAHHLGTDVATTNNQLSQVMQMPDIGSAGRRDVPNSVKLTELIKLARALGHPIAADRNGIYYAKTKEEALKAAEEHYSRAMTYNEQGDLLKNMAVLLPSAQRTELSVAA